MRRLTGFVCLLAGCVTTSSALRARFATERGCPESQVEVESAGGTHYRASGCGETTVYVCQSFTKTSENARDCVEEGARPPSGNRERERERPVLPPPDPRIPGR